MRKISRDAANAFKNDVTFHRDNTQVVVLRNKTLFYLFGNLIAIKKDGYLHINNCGYPTRVTHDRLNAIFYELGMLLHIRRESFLSLLTSDDTVIAYNLNLKYRGKINGLKKIPPVSP